MRLPIIGRYGLLLVPLGFLVVFFFYPLLNILIVSLFPESGLDLSGFEDLFSTRYLNVVLFTVGQAVISTVLTVGLALPSAYVFTRYRFPGKSLMLSLSVLPFVLPTVVVAAAFQALVWDDGLLNTALMNLLKLESPPIQLENTLTIILIVHVFYNYAIALRMLVGYWANQSTRIEEAAQVLGANGWRLWMQIRLPVLRPALLSSAILVFIFTFTSFGVILLLGGFQFRTLEVEIYNQAVNVFDLPTAAALSLVQIGAMFAMMILYTRLQRDTATDLQQAAQVARRPRGSWERVLVGMTLVLIVVLLFTPLVALIVRSLTVGGFGIENYLRLSENPRSSVTFVAPTEAIGNSLVFAALTTGLALTLGTLTAYLLNLRGRVTRWLDPVFMLPLATSAVTLGFAFIITFDEPPLNIRASAVLVVLAHTLVALPFVVRSVLPALRAIPDSVREAAGVLGASPFAVWRSIDLPLVSRGMVVGATFAFTVSMGEFGASVFVARFQSPTMPTVIFDLLGQPGAANYGQALAMSVILMAVCAVSFVVIERLRTAGVGEF